MVAFPAAYVRSLLTVMLLATLAAAGMAADGGTTIDLSSVFALWERIEKGGVPFFMFLIIIALFTGQVSSKKQGEQVITLLKENAQNNDARWKERFEEANARTNRAEQQLEKANERVASLAETVERHLHSLANTPKS